MPLWLNRLLNRPGTLKRRRAGAYRFPIRMAWAQVHDPELSRVDRWAAWRRIKLYRVLARDLAGAPLDDLGELLVLSGGVTAGSPGRASGPGRASRDGR